MINRNFVSTIALAFSAWTLTAFCPFADAVVPTPSVIGPLPSDKPGSPDHNYPFFATDLVLGDFGYVEEEFFFDAPRTAMTRRRLRAALAITPHRQQPLTSSRAEFLIARGCWYAGRSSRPASMVL